MQRRLRIIEARGPWSTEDVFRLKRPRGGQAERLKPDVGYAAVAIAPDIPVARGKQPRESGMISRFRGIVLLAAGLVLAVGCRQRDGTAIAPAGYLVVPYSGRRAPTRCTPDRQSDVALARSGRGDRERGGPAARGRMSASPARANGTTVLIKPRACSLRRACPNLRYDTEKDFEPVGLVNNAPMLWRPQVDPRAGAEGFCR